MASAKTPGAELETTLDNAVIPQREPTEVRVEFGSLTHAGKVRESNEDHFAVVRLTKALRVLRTNLPKGETPRLADQDAYLMAVADGMGGAAAGERASALVIAEMERYILETSKWFFHRYERDTETIQREVNQGLRQLDQIVIDEGESDWRLTGMGTTLTAALSFGPELTVIQVGDSRAYLFRAGTLKKITRDHTLAQILVDGGAMSAEQAGATKARHVLTNVLGGPSEGVSGDVHSLHLLDGDRLLLCSDGLTDMVTEPEIARLLGLDAKPQAACQALVDAALEGGGRDNVTVVLADYRITY